MAKKRGATCLTDGANSFQQVAIGVVLFLGLAGISIIIIITAATLALVAKHRRRAHIVAESVPRHTPSHLCLLVSRGRTPLWWHRCLLFAENLFGAVDLQALGSRCD